MQPKWHKLPPVLRDGTPWRCYTRERLRPWELESSPSGKSAKHGKTKILDTRYYGPLPVEEVENERTRIE